MNENKDNDVSFAEFLETVAKMTLEDFIKCIRSSLNAPKVFLKRATNEMRVNLFNGKILLAWKANLDIQIVLEPYGCASYVVGYISKSQRGMSAQLEAAAKEARNGNSDILVVDQLPRLGKRELICLLSFTCNYVVFVWRGFLFLWVLGMGYVILLWQSLSLPYNYKKTS